MKALENFLKISDILIVSTKDNVSVIKELFFSLPMKMLMQQ